MARTDREPDRPEAEPTPPPNGDNTQVQDRLAEVERELSDTKDRLLRVLADQENARRVAARNREDSVRFAVADLARDLVETLDNLERALQSGTGTGESGDVLQQLLSGVASTERSLLSALDKHGIRRVEPRGEPFDPRLHHAVFQRPDLTVPEGTIIEVVQPGYMIHDRLLRPAMVGVASNEAGAPASD
ncbi:MAG: heat shock protein GrpE-like protein [Hyphomicrobiales bacterium]|nr:heat shock protein GrpE-like protein [Hyphomicrobiales bacterium]